MTFSWIAFAEMLLVLGGVLGLAVYELISLRRHRKCRERQALEQSPPDTPSGP